MAYEKYKDTSPADTVARARALLAELGIAMRETEMHTVDGAYSVRLDDTLHGWSVNGKGTTAAYCLASGYGEAMERLQGYFGYRASLANAETESYRGFHHAPDEVIHGIHDIKALSPAVWSLMEEAWVRSGDLPNDEKMAETWAGLIGERTSFVPYWSVHGRKAVMLPDTVIAMLDGSSGLAAGNSPHEALCQGLCEVFERYVQRTVHERGLTPPRIPREYIAQEYPSLDATIRQIESMGNYRVYVRDGSMGKGYPVVSIVLVDRERQRYHIKFGAHPTFAIALERCLTELLEGYAPGNASQDKELLVPWTAEPIIPYECGRNLDALFTSGAAVYPHAALAGEPSWAFTPWSVNGAFTNEKGVHALISMLTEIAEGVYVRDQGFLGFPAYRIFVPGITSVFSHVGSENLRNQNARLLLTSLCDENCALTQAQRLEIIAFLESENTSMNRNLTLHDGVLPSLAHAALLRDAGEPWRAAAILRALPTGTHQFRCAAMELELAAQGISEAERDALLGMFLSDKSLSYVRLYWRGESVLRNLYRSPFKRLYTAGVKTYDESIAEMRDRVSRLHMRMKDKMHSNMPDQANMAALF